MPERDPLFFDAEKEKKRVEAFSKDLCKTSEPDIFGILASKLRAEREFELLMRIASVATDLVNECEGRDIPPSLGVMAQLADAVHAHWKFQRGDANG